MNIAKVISLLLLILCSNVFAFAEPWERKILTEKRGEADFLHVLPGGDLIVAGKAALTSSTSVDAWVSRYSSDGEQIWSTSILGNYYSPIASIIVQDDQIIVSGTHQTPNPFNANFDSFVAALSLDGELKWETRLTDPDGGIWGGKLYVLQSGDIFVAGGYFDHDRSINQAAHYARLSSEGGLIWSQYVIPTGKYYEDLEPARSTLRNKDGEAIHRERSGPVIETDSEDLHLHIIRSDMFASGEIGRCVVVSKTGKVQESQTCERLIDAEASSDSVRARTIGGGNVLTKEILVEKVDNQSKVEWSWTYESENRSGLTDYVKLEDGGVLGVGYVILEDGKKYHRYDAVMFRLDSEGNEVWKHTIGDEKRDIFTKIVPAENGQFYIIGHSGSDYSIDWDPWIIKIGLDGKLPVEPKYD